MPLRKLYLELTNKCNLNCTMCYRHSWNEKLMDMNTELFQKIKEETSRIESLKSIVLGGIGEPTCAPLICRAIEEYGNYDLTVTTNAVTIEAKLMNMFVKYVNMVMISIDGLYENFNKIRGTSLNYIIENINQMNKLKAETGSNTPYIGIQFVISKDNVEDIFRLIDLASELKVETLVLSNLLPQTEENAKKILYRRYENKEMKLLLSKASNYSFRKGIKVILPNSELKTERRCSFIDDETAFITATGEIVPCYRLSHTYNEYVFGRKKTVLKHAFGDLNTNTLTEIWESKEYKGFRETVRNNRYPSCIDCDLVEGCDLVKDTATDCYAGMPSCADCLWTRKYVMCP